MFFFVSNDGQRIREIINETIETRERVTRPIEINAYTNYLENPVHVAAFTLGLSIRDKSSINNLTGSKI